MGSLSDESFEQFLESLKQAGVFITNEEEVRVRLAEAQRWRYAFATLAANGQTLGIRFEDRSAGANGARICDTLVRFHFPEQLQTIFADSLKSEH